MLATELSLENAGVECDLLSITVQTQMTPNQLGC